jgi:hypothetical protein
MSIKRIQHIMYFVLASLPSMDLPNQAHFFECLCVGLVERRESCELLEESDDLSDSERLGDHLQCAIIVIVKSL